MSTVQKVWPLCIGEAILLQHGPSALAPVWSGQFDSVVNFPIFLLFMKGFDSADVCHMINSSFLEANCSVVIDLCDLAGPIAFWFVLRLLRALTDVSSPREQLCAHQDLFSRLLFLLILVCFCCQMCSQSDMCFAFEIASRPNADCIGEAWSVVWRVARSTANIVAAGIPVQGSSESIVWTLNGWMMFPIVWFTRFTITFACGFPVVGTFCPSERMGCSDNGNAHTSILDTAADFRAGFLPLVGEHGGWFPQQDLGFFTEETIRRCHEPRKVPTLLEAGPEAFLLFLAFMSCWHFVWVLIPIGLGIDIHDPNICDPVRALRPEATNQNVTTVLIAIVGKEAFDWVFLVFFIVSQRLLYNWSWLEHDLIAHQCTASLNPLDLASTSVEADFWDRFVLKGGCLRQIWVQLADFFIWLQICNFGGRWGLI
jgi:hypothetical protein